MFRIIVLSVRPVAKRKKNLMQSDRLCIFKKIYEKIEIFNFLCQKTLHLKGFAAYLDINMGDKNAESITLH